MLQVIAGIGIAAMVHQRFDEKDNFGIENGKLSCVSDGDLYRHFLAIHGPATGECGSRVIDRSVTWDVSTDTSHGHHRQYAPAAAVGVRDDCD